MFNNPEVTPAKDIDIAFNPPNQAGGKVLIEEKGFEPKRVEKASSAFSRRERWALKRMDSFFKVMGPKTGFAKLGKRAGDKKGKNGKKKKPRGVSRRR